MVRGEKRGMAHCTPRVFPGSDGSSAAICGNDEETWSPSDTLPSTAP